MTEVERTAHFPVPAAELWEALTDPALLAEWFGAREADPSQDRGIDLDLRPGATWRFGDHIDGSRTRTAVVEAVEPGRRLAFTWSDDGDVPGSRVEIDVIELDDGESELRVREALLDDLDDLGDLGEFGEFGDGSDFVDIDIEPFPIGFRPPRALARA